ncbi:unnamed protein product [Paramecium octaurelia]|uniref:Uncharacterized protein n=1 Tax=Paramecium octaurelia TaxID=43137 RepID=A0A8S1T1X1_PAROT|nr:unnamed protein product [Paramecium octaurelia]
MLSSPVETRFKNNRESMSNIIINKQEQPNNVQLKKSHQYSQSHQILDQQIDENHFFIPKYSLRRVKYSDQNSKTAFSNYLVMKNQTIEKSLQSQLIDKYLHENSIHLHRIKPLKQIAFKELVSSSQANKKIKKQGNMNTEPNQDKKTLPVMPQSKSSQVVADLYKFTFYSPKTQENKLRLPKEFLIQPCSKKKYFI